MSGSPGGGGDLASPSESGGSRANIFIQTDDWKVKSGVFATLALILYFIWWGIFRIFLNQNRSPRTLFRYTFMGYLVFVYVAAFLCFSEYALTQAYDPTLSYMSQIQIITLVISSGIWLLLAFILSYVLEGKTN